MAFLLNCPNCGDRNVLDFRFGGETLSRPGKEASPQERTQYYYFRKNEAGVQQEWWYHKYGCRKWFFAMRDTRTNEVLRTYWPEGR
jgi:sarcosine oxidase subunit delta